MNFHVRILAFLLLVTAESALARPLIIAHRGASGHLPDHTLEAYKLAVEQGADVIEPDLVATRDGVLVARHENNITETTDASVRFPDRRATRTIDGKEHTGWFTEDFTLAELKTLRARQPLDFRPQEFNGKFEIATFDELLALIPALEQSSGRKIGIEPEIKHPSYFRSIGIPLEEPLVEALDKAGYRDEKSLAFIQCFEVESLQKLDEMTGVRLLLLIDGADEPWLKPAGMAKLKGFADGLGVHKEHLIPQKEGRWQAPNQVVEQAHQAGLDVHVYTFRDEDRYLSKDDQGDPLKEYSRFVALGVDGLFTDFPDTAARSVPP